MNGMLTPWVLYLALFLLFPLLTTVGLSFCDWDFINAPRWNDGRNWASLVQDPMVAKSLWNTCCFAVLFALSESLGGLALGLLMHQRSPWIGSFRTLCYLPTVLSGVASTLIGMWLFHPGAGLLNRGLAQFGILGPRWLLDPGWALLALWAMTFWGVGRAAMLFLASRQALPDHLYEAACLEGASSWQMFTTITLPLLRPTLLFNLVVSLATALQSFTAAYVATGGGPQESTTLLVLYLYQVAFQQMRMGYAAALGLLLFLLAFGLSWWMEGFASEDEAELVL
jgi:multiple sugar transport system permease protein